VTTFGEEALRPNCFRPWWPKTLIRLIAHCPVVGIAVVGTATASHSYAERDADVALLSLSVFVYLSACNMLTLVFCTPKILVKFEWNNPHQIQVGFVIKLVNISLYLTSDTKQGHH